MGDPPKKKTVVLIFSSKQALAIQVILDWALATDKKMGEDMRKAAKEALESIEKKLGKGQE